MEPITTYDGYTINYQYSPVEDAQATVIFSHGFVEYSAHYSKLASQLNAYGFNVFKYDLRGHGRTTAPLGDLKAYEDFALDLNECVQWVKDKDSTLPIYTMGFSMGGMITALYGILYPYEVSGQILLGAGLSVASQFNDVTDDEISVLKFLEMMGTTGDGGIRQLIAMDSPYVIKKTTRRFLVESLVKAPTFIQENYAMYQLPVLLIHGQQDPIITYKGSQKFYDEIGSDDKEILIYPEYEHDLLRIPDAPKIIAVIAEWINRHL